MADDDEQKPKPTFADVRARRNLLTVPEAAELAGRSTDTIYRWVRGGQLVYVRTKGEIHIAESEVIELAGKIHKGKKRRAAS